jgi:hypothetical protein
MVKNFTAYTSGFKDINLRFAVIVKERPRNTGGKQVTENI